MREQAKWRKGMVEAIKRRDQKAIVRLLERSFEKTAPQALGLDGHIEGLEAFAVHFPEQWTAPAKALALRAAIQGDQKEAAAWLLKEGADPWMRESQIEGRFAYDGSENDWHAMHWAAAEGYLWAMRMLRDAEGFDASEELGMVAMLAASSNNNPPALDLALDWLGELEPQKALEAARRARADCEGMGVPQSLTTLDAFAARQEARVIEQTSRALPKGAPKAL